MRIPASDPTEIGIVLYPGVQTACVHGLTDLFGIAANLAHERERNGQARLRVTHWENRTRSGNEQFTCVFDSEPHGNPNPGILIIPPTMVGLPDPPTPEGTASWLRNRHADGATLISICSGAFLLAATGLVIGRVVTTHHICAEALAKRFPEITVDANSRIVDHGDVITAGGFMAWVDIGLFLVSRIVGPSVRTETARFILSDSAASEAHYFAGFAPPQAHGDVAVLKAQEWVHMRDGSGVSLTEMATAAGLERRTFLRRFARATGMTPIEYCRAIRIARARELLQCGNTSQKEIAQSLGYRDVTSFRRAFHRAMGLAPGAYRRNFSGNTATHPDAHQEALTRELPAFETKVPAG